MPPIDDKAPLGSYSKTSNKSLRQQIDVVAEFHAYKIHPLRIAYRTGIDATLVQHLVNGEDHQRMFKAALARHRKSRRDQRLHKSLRHKGIAQTELQVKIEQDYQETTGKN
jgi:hypothetical protein